MDRPETSIQERRRRNDAIDLKLEEIVKRIDHMETQLIEQRKAYAVIHEHMEIIREIISVANRIRGVAIWFAAFAAAIVSILTLGERLGWW